MTISTLSLNNANRATLMRLQGQLKDANKELTTERHADVGATLGRLTGTAVGYRVQETAIDAQIETNKVVTGRLELAGNVMKSVADAADGLTGSLLSAEKYGDYPELARSALKSMQGALNTSVGGLYVFGGQNAGEAPIKDIDDAVAAAKAYFGNFLKAAGTDLNGDPASIKPANVPADALGRFLGDGYKDGAGTVWKFSDLTDAGWATDWSTASSANTAAAISKTETVETSVSANETAFRKVASAYSMLAAIATPDLNDAARTVVARQAAVTLKSGTDGLTALRAKVGTREARVDAAGKALTQQKDIVNAAFTRLEGVDQTEVGLRITQLETQLQASYTVTGRLQKLSILDYI